MKLARYRHSNMESYGVLVDNGIICLLALPKAVNCQPPLTFDDLIALGNNGIRIVEQLLRISSQREKRNATVGVDDVTLLAPVLSPPKIVCLGLNYRDHAAEQGKDIPDEPILFMKPRTAIIGPDQPIVRPKGVKQLDYEAELAIVIGQKGKNVPISEARNFIFGYTILNDVSARDIQFKDKQWTRGKGFDSFAPMGPCITTADQLKDPGNLGVRTKVNGELRQDSSTKNMVFGVCEIVHRLSQVMTLEVGDVIATGTPAGVGIFMKPRPKFLSPGDLVEVEIEEVGTLRNTVSKENLLPLSE
ncbi:MAG: fumarylacetoacetate hydrolase family protein [Candidatus Bathyarchaeota archaeon]|nr:MAG: fumarylacetoacetate hydrolase family protein [Candidatus Bathyarchaeota archaeon]